MVNAVIGEAVNVRQLLVKVAADARLGATYQLLAVLVQTVSTAE